MWCGVDGFSGCLGKRVRQPENGFGCGWHEYAVWRRAVAVCFICGSLKTAFGAVQTRCRALGGNVKRVVFWHGVAVLAAVIRHGVWLLRVAFLAVLPAERGLDAPHAVLFGGAVKADLGC